MDSIDKNILIDLLINCRITYQELSSKYGLSANGIKKRINIMKDKGVLKDYYVELTLNMIDAEFCMAIIHTDGTEHKQDFINLLGNDERVNTIGYTSGSNYLVFAIYKNGSSGIYELTNLYRNHKFVKTVEIHPMVYDLGNKIPLSRTDLTILKYLFSDPRRPVSDIAKKTGLSSQVISSTIKNLNESGVIHFSAHFNTNAGDWITFLAKITYSGNLEEIITWIATKYPEEFFFPAAISASEPLAFIAFIVNELSRVSEISNQLKEENSSITSVMTLLGEPSFSFPDLRIIELQKMLSEI